MPLPTIDDTARLVLHWHNATDARVAVNVMHFLRADNTKTLAQLVSDFDNSVASFPDIAAPCGSSWRCDTISATALYDTSLTVDHTMVANLQGGTSGDWVPQVAPLVKMTTDVRGRSGRGRLFLPPAAESAMDSAGIATAKQTACTAAWDGLANNMATGYGDWAIAIASYKLRVSHEVTNIACEKVTGTQRRRNR